MKDGAEEEGSRSGRTCGWLAVLAAIGTLVSAYGIPTFGNYYRAIRDSLDAGVFFVFMFGIFGVFTDRRPGLAKAMLAIGLVGWAVLRPSDQQVNWRRGANTRACYSNQKTLVGAIEMYNLDKNTRRAVLDAAFFHALRSGGYLQSVPQDPGQGNGTSGHYRITGESVTCDVHGKVK